MSLEGKVALITGTSSGLGYAMARVFSSQGAKVVAAARRRERGEALEKEVRKAGGECVFIKTDVARVEDCRQAVQGALDTFGRLDLLVNNAGIGSDPAVIPSHEVEEAQWDAVVDTNLKGAFFCSRYALPALIASGRGHIVNISSLNAIAGPARMAAYSSSKAGLLQLTKTLAVEYQPEGVRVNAIILGGVASETQQRSSAAMASFVTGKDPDDIAVSAAMQDPEEVSRAIALLCHDDAHLITGASIAIDRAATAGAMASHLIYLTTAGVWKFPVEE